MSLLYHLMGRSFRPVAGLLAALTLALSPISVATKPHIEIRVIYILWDTVLNCHSCYSGRGCESW
jgi:hypothetical protein